MDEEKVPRFGLNAPFGARCFLALFLRTCGKPLVTSLNAPFGARYFLTNFPVFTSGKFNAS